MHNFFVPASATDQKKNAPSKAFALHPVVSPGFDSQPMKLTQANGVINVVISHNAFYLDRANATGIVRSMLITAARSGIKKIRIIIPGEETEYDNQRFLGKNDKDAKQECGHAFRKYVNRYVKTAILCKRYFPKVKVIYLVADKNDEWFKASKKQVDGGDLNEHTKKERRINVFAKQLTIVSPEQKYDGVEKNEEITIEIVPFGKYTNDWEKEIQSKLKANDDLQKEFLRIAVQVAIDKSSAQQGAEDRRVYFEAYQPTRKVIGDILNDIVCGEMVMDYLSGMNFVIDYMIKESGKFKKMDELAAPGDVMAYAYSDRQMAFDVFGLMKKIINYENLLLVDVKESAAPKAEAGVSFVPSAEEGAVSACASPDGELLGSIKARILGGPRLDSSETDISSDEEGFFDVLPEATESALRFSR